MILEFATKYDFYMIEDDYLGDFEGSKSYKTLYEMDTNQRVIYLKSFSKIMFPGQRLGITVLPECMIDIFQSYKEIIDIHTNSISQIIMQTFIESGLYEHHKDKIVLRHLQKAHTLRDVLKTYFSNYEFNDNHQMHTVIKLPKQIDMNKLHQELSETSCFS
ncbi:aminotransferase class I/II-fold pyridoxal phosphate-dependent enzyme [Oceanobacillus jeddahense]|uniref:aminotransferase class I/II-fold pyridoxal phosphate-dependent enzyme n=1 Tax=Oceanobacillus jeddahense TaxID=1462527 RepID=UPI003640F018